MKVFISWSGTRSKAMAGALKEWLPLILQYVDPWVSDKDIHAGDRWAQAVAGELESSDFGILCITPENLNAEWILFEAGALSKRMQDSKVIPLLFGLELSDLSGPLSQFQAIKVDEQGMLDVAKSINAVSENGAADATIEQLVPALWPQLQTKLKAIPIKGIPEKHVRPQQDILEDLVSQVRGLSGRMQELDLEASERETPRATPSLREVDYIIVDDLMHRMSSSRDGDLALLMLAGVLRDRTPWISECLIEARRELRSGISGKRVEEVYREVMDVVEWTFRGPFGDKAFGRGKWGQRLLHDVPHMIERALRFSTREIAEKSLPGIE